MFRKIDKKSKTSKQGVILVTVLFILAVSLVLISCAVMISQMTRQRVYIRAEDNQARLTVTACAEAFWQSIVSQEIRDASLADLATAGAKNHTASYIEMIDPNIPGMGGTSDNQTIVYFYPGEQADTVVCDFNTTIDESTERVVLTLWYEKPTESDKKGFQHQVLLFGGGGIFEADVGEVLSEGITAKNNTILVNEASFVTNGSGHIFSDVIFTGAFTNHDTYFLGDVVFWGANASYNMTGHTNGVRGDSNYESPYSGITYTKNPDVYFINTNDIFTNGVGPAYNDSSTTIGRGNQMFYGSYDDNDFATMNDDAWGSVSYANYEYTFNGLNIHDRVMTTDYTSETVTTDMTTVASRYANGNYNSSATTITAWSDAEGAYGVSNWNLEAGKTKKSIAELAVLSASEKGIEPGKYFVEDAVLNGQIITVDLSKGKYYFFFPDGLTINTGFFEIMNSDAASGNAVYLVIGNKSLTINGANGIPFRGIIDGAVMGATMSMTRAERDACYTADNAKAPNQNVVPGAYVLGYGNGTDKSHTNQVYVDGNGNAVLQCNIGLYNSAADVADSGTLYSYNSKTQFYYGRWMIGEIDQQGGGNVTLPYCPIPVDPSNPPRWTMVETQYRVVGFQYYVDADETPAES